MKFDKSLLISLLRNCVVIAWLVFALYVSLAGYLGSKLVEGVPASLRNADASDYVRYQDLTFKTEKDIKLFLLDERASGWFTWLPDFPTELLSFLLSAGFGMFGASVFLLYRAIVDLSTHRDLVRPTFSYTALGPALGASIAVAVYLLAFILPSVLAVGSPTLRSETLAALSFMSGFGHNVVFRWLGSQIEKLTA